MFVLAARKDGAKSPAEIDAALKKAKPLFDKRDKILSIESDKWQREIEMLEGRVKETHEATLLGGKTIEIRSYLNNDESKRLGELQKKQRDFNPETDDPQILEEIMYEILGLVTANPLLDADYWRQHEGEYAMVDALMITTGYFENQVEQIKERNEKVRRAQSFREDQSGAELRSVPALHEGDKS